MLVFIFEIFEYLEFDYKDFINFPFDIIKLNLRFTIEKILFK